MWTRTTVCENSISRSFLLLTLCTLLANSVNSSSNTTRGRANSLNLRNLNASIISDKMRNSSLFTEEMLSEKTLLKPTGKSSNSSTPGGYDDFNKDREISLVDVYRHRVLISGYLIVSVVTFGLIFLLVTHYLGKREIRRAQQNPRGPYRAFTKWELQHS